LPRAERANTGRSPPRRQTVCRTISPHPLLFAPIARRLEELGHEVLVTVRDHAQTAELAFERWPDAHDGYDCLGMVCQARGNNRQAAEYYRMVVTVARTEPCLYDPGFQDYYRDLIDRLDPTAAHKEFWRHTPGISKAR